MHHYAHGPHAKMLINYTAPFIYTLPDPDKVLWVAVRASTSTRFKL